MLRPGTSQALRLAWALGGLRTPGFPVLAGCLNHFPQHRPLQPQQQAGRSASAPTLTARAAQQFQETVKKQKSPHPQGLRALQFRPLPHVKPYPQQFRQQQHRVFSAKATSSSWKPTPAAEDEFKQRSTEDSEKRKAKTDSSAAWYGSKEARMALPPNQRFGDVMSYDAHRRFADLQLHPAVVKSLAAAKIERPTRIQVRHRQLFA